MEMIELLSFLMQWAILFSIPYVIYLRFKPQADTIIKKAVYLIRRVSTQTP